jgi:hypothetical protein
MLSCLHSRQSSALRFTEYGLAGYLVCDDCGADIRQLSGPTVQARIMNHLPRHAVTHGDRTDEVAVREYTTLTSRAPAYSREAPGHTGAVRQLSRFPCQPPPATTAPQTVWLRPAPSARECSVLPEGSGGRAGW